MKKTLLSALGLAVALAFSMPIIGASSADAATVQNNFASIIATTITTIITTTRSWWQRRFTEHSDLPNKKTALDFYPGRSSCCSATWHA
jgi:hypothetical protein